MPWLVTEPVPWDGLLTAVVWFAVSLAVVCLAALFGYLWECAQLRKNSIRNTHPRSAQVRAPEPTSASASLIA